jgi:hypothetical protein
MGSALGESSFLKRAWSPVDYLENARVELAWADDSTSETPLSPRVTGGPEDPNSESVCYVRGNGFYGTARGELLRRACKHLARTHPLATPDCTFVELITNRGWSGKSCSVASPKRYLR